MNGCREWNDRLLDLALGGLKSAEARAVDAHLAHCPACATALSALRARAEALDAATRQLVHAGEPSPSFPTRVLAGLEARSLARAWRPWRLALLGGLLGSVLVVAVFLRPSLGKWWPIVRQPAPKPLADLSAWRSPTDRLLRFSGEELLESTPRLGSLYFSLESAQDDRQKD